MMSYPRQGAGRGCGCWGVAGVFVFAGVVFGVAGGAMGQNALGDGRGLEANPKQGSSGRNFQRPSLESEMQFRNAVATGNAPGGLSFRGDLGYQAPGEFAGVLGSDSLYSFRRDSLYSGLAGMGIRGTDALQYQFSMTTGSYVTRNLVGNLSVSRFEGGVGGSDLVGGSRLSDPLRVAEPESIYTGGVLRSTSSYSSTVGLTPELISVYEEGIQKKRFGVVSTPLMGLVSSPIDDGVVARRVGEERPETANTSYAERIEEVRERAAAIRAKSDLEAGDGAGDGEGDEGDGVGEENNEWITERLTRLQRQVMGLPEPAGEDEPVEIVQEGGNGVEIRDPLGAGGDDGEEDGAPEIGFDRGEGLVGSSRYTIDPETLEMIHGDGKRVTYLIDPSAEVRNVYVDHMLEGERLLGAGRYFDAEERFASALGVRRGNVLAQLGRFHAQIGAGLVMSASVNFQLLMSEHIEIVSTRYSGGLLPEEERIKELIVTLRERAGLDERESYVVDEPRRVRVACGLLISYLGYQIDDQEQVSDGFGVVERIGTVSDKRFVRLLEAVWGATFMTDDEREGVERDGSEP